MSSMVESPRRSNFCRGGTAAGLSACEMDRALVFDVRFDISAW